jgi:hypothetical protein
MGILMLIYNQSSLDFVFSPIQWLLFLYVQLIDFSFICYLINLFQENTLTLDNQVSTQDGQEASVVTQTERKVTVTVENDLVSQAKEEEVDMEALLDT